MYIMKIFGQKVKPKDVKTFGTKLSKNLSVFGRKVVNSVDKIAPIAATVAMAAGHPEVGLAIEGGQILAHSVNNAVQSGHKVLSGKQADVNNNMVTFGEDVNMTKDVVNNLLRRD